MSNVELGPYRATALWNEAVTCFRDGMQLAEHRHRFHKHKNCFTGSDAVRFLHKCLQLNGLFNPNVTRDQTKQLLNQFLSADLICQAKDCSVSGERKFHDSSKYIYEFTNKLRSFKGNLPLTSINNRLRDLKPASAHATYKELTENELSTNDNEWKLQILNRIKDFLNPLDVSSLIPIEKIEAKWVVTNASPEWVKLKWNTELPHWILSAIHNLIGCATTCDVSDTYPEFEIELFKIISDYFATLGSSLICPFLFDLIINVYLYFDSLNSLIGDKTTARITTSQENLLECISSPRKKLKTPSVNRSISNLCLETAFTSDNPVMRVVPQRTYDIVHLKTNADVGDKRTGLESYENSSFPKTAGGRRTKAKVIRTPFQEIENLEKNCHLNYKNIVKSCNGGIDNAAFSFFSPGTERKEERVEKSFPHHYFKSSPEFGRYMKSKSSDNLDNIHVYVNHGLNSSIDDSEHCDSILDYKFAIESVNKLLKVSQRTKSSSSVDTTESYYTASTSSSPDIFEDNPYENINSEELKLLHGSQKKGWQKPISKMCASVFQLILLLIPPNHRAQLKHLMRVLHHVPNSSNCQPLSFPHMVAQLQNVILRPILFTSAYDARAVFSIIQFLANNYEVIFSELPDNIIHDVENHVFDGKSKENVFCEQVSKPKFEEQKIASSNSALDELLCQILSNKSLSQKDRKRHLKMFKEYYPEIYLSRIGTKEKLPKKTSSKHFRV